MLPFEISIYLAVETPLVLIISVFSSTLFFSVDIHLQLCNSKQINCFFTTVNVLRYVSYRDTDIAMRVQKNIEFGNVTVNYVLFPKLLVMYPGCFFNSFYPNITSSLTSKYLIFHWLYIFMVSFTRNSFSTISANRTLRLPTMFSFLDYSSYTRNNFSTVSFIGMLSPATEVSFSFQQLRQFRECGRYEWTNNVL